jgi:glutamate carboxypeptidase
MTLARISPALQTAALRREHRYVATLEALVRFESPTHDKALVDLLMTHLEATLVGHAWETERVPREAVGDLLVARKGWGEGGLRTLLLAHADTVWPQGTLAEMPFRREDDRVYGPGILDMKAGIATATEAVCLLEESGVVLRGPVTLLITSDEEMGSLHSRELIERLAREHDRVFVLEPGRDDGALKVGRKGVGNFFLTVVGKSAHAGNHPELGASALRELAHFLLFAEALTDPEANTSVNVTVAQGGTASNVIAERARATVDFRVLRLDEAERVIRAVKRYRPADSRVQLIAEGGLNRPPMEPTAANSALFEEAKAYAAGFGVTLEGAVVGGASDGNFTSALGLPTLDGLGAVGGGPHARHEHIRVRETLERVALLAALLAA